MSELSSLPEKLQLHILSFCDVNELFMCGRVQRRWYKTVVQEEPWFALSRRNARRALRAEFTLHKPKKPKRQVEHTTTSTVTATATATATAHPFRRSGSVGSKRQRRRRLRPLGQRFARVPFATEGGEFDGRYHRDSRDASSSSEDDDSSGNADGEDDYLQYLSHSDRVAYGHATSSRGKKSRWRNAIQCPIPPAPEAASLGREFEWTSMARHYDGGHGGAREYHMRCLRYFSFSPEAAYGTYIGPDSDEELAIDGAARDDNMTDCWGTDSDGEENSYNGINGGRVPSSSSSSSDSDSDSASWVSPASSVSDLVPAQTMGLMPPPPPPRLPSPPPQQQHRDVNHDNSSTSGGMSPWSFEPAPSPLAVSFAPTPTFASGNSSTRDYDPYGTQRIYNNATATRATYGGGGPDLLDELFGGPAAVVVPRSMPRSRDVSQGHTPLKALEHHHHHHRPQQQRQRSATPAKLKLKLERDRRHRADRQARRQRFSECYECRCFRRWQELQPGGSYVKLSGKGAIAAAVDAAASAAAAASSPSSSHAHGGGGGGMRDPHRILRQQQEQQQRDRQRHRRIPLFILSPNRCCLLSPSTHVWSTALLSHLRLAIAQRRDRQRARYMDSSGREETQDGSEGLFQGKTMSVSFKVEFYDLDAGADDARQNELLQRQNRHSRGEPLDFSSPVRGGGGGDTTSGGSGGAVLATSVGCFIGFVEARDAYRFQLQPTAASVAKRRRALARENATRSGGNQQQRQRQDDALSPYGGGSGGGGGYSYAEEDDEAAEMIAALAADIQDREAHTGYPGLGGSGDEDDKQLANARRWWSAPPPAQAVDADDESPAFIFTGETGGNYSHGQQQGDDGRSGAADDGSGGEDARDEGGIFIGDCQGSYGLNIMTGYLHQNGHAYLLANPHRAHRLRKPSGGGTTNSSSSVNSNANSGHNRALLSLEDDSTDNIFTLVFDFDNDCIALNRANGDQVAVVLVDAFSEGQTWLPAVSCRGCGVSVLPPHLVL